MRRLFKKSDWRRLREREKDGFSSVLGLMEENGSTPGEAALPRRRNHLLGGARCSPDVFDLLLLGLLPLKDPRAAFSVNAALKLLNPAKYRSSQLGSKGKMDHTSTRSFSGT